MALCLIPESGDSFLVGDTLRAEMTFEDPDPDDPDDPYVDPDQVFVRVRHPEGTPPTDEYEYDVDLEVVKTDVGRYYLLITPDQPGEWAVQFEGVGTWPKLAELTFKARAGSFAP